jgi:hypothetical protein
VRTLRRDPGARVLLASPWTRRPDVRGAAARLHRRGRASRTLEYLDALLRGGTARFADVAERMERALTARGVTDPQAWMRGAGPTVDRALAEAVTLAVDDVVLR